jgi:hypothetical protein
MHALEADVSAYPNGERNLVPMLDQHPVTAL